MPKGEKVWAQSKRTAPYERTIRILKKWSFQIGISHYVQKGEKVLVSSKTCKTLLNTKRRTSLRGSFVLVKGKAFETGGEKLKILKMLPSILFIYLWLFSKCFEKNFTKDLQKQN
jgi:hypothetical protein